MRALDVLAWIAAAALVLGATSGAPLPQAPIPPAPRPETGDGRPPHAVTTASRGGTGVLSRLKSLGQSVGRYAGLVAQHEKNEWTSIYQTHHLNPGFFAGATVGVVAVAPIPVLDVVAGSAAAFAGDGLWQVAVDHRNPFNGKALPVAPPQSDALSGWPIGD
ncbi:MAG: hypothetical protein M1826_004444 [Phylliscum demangeonii]|nr:MAG: hypothetical protein M1826_004444 [Phylliscum demangeonii]